VLEVEVWLLVSVAVLDAGALVDGVLEEAAPVCALSFAAVPVVDVGALLDAAPVVSAGVVELAGGFWFVVLLAPTPVDDVWSVTGGCPAAFDGLDAGAVLCAFGSVVPLVDCVLVELDCAFWSGVVVVAVLVLLC
jgi:hypothetical protein